MAYTLELVDDETGQRLVWRMETEQQETAIANLLLNLQIWPDIALPVAEHRRTA